MCVPAWVSCKTLHYITMTLRKRINCTCWPVHHISWISLIEFNVFSMSLLRDAAHELAWRWRRAGRIPWRRRGPHITSPDRTHGCSCDAVFVLRRRVWNRTVSTRLSFLIYITGPSYTPPTPTKHRPPAHTHTYPTKTNELNPRCLHSWKYERTQTYIVDTGPWKRSIAVEYAQL